METVATSRAIQQENSDTPNYNAWLNTKAFSDREFKVVRVKQSSIGALALPAMPDANRLR